jgi:guanosine-3',5'-bis(diphosphate) 3'-pyrophosphohydrolase
MCYSFHMTEKIELAKEYFRRAHDSIGQKRKYTDEPYWVHTEAVAQLVWDATQNEDTTIAALGHDVLEDVTPKNSEYSLENLIKEFGSVVAQYVVEVTNVFTHEAYPDMNRAKRKHAEHERLAKISLGGKAIKLADIAHNVYGIVDQNRDFAKVFVAEKTQALVFLRDGNPMLYKMAVKNVADEIAKLTKV